MAMLPIEPALQRAAAYADIKFPPSHTRDDVDTMLICASTKLLNLDGVHKVAGRGSARIGFHLQNDLMNTTIAQNF